MDTESPGSGSATPREQSLPDPDGKVWGDADVRCVFVFLNGNIACTDKDGAQVPSEQEPPLVTALHDKLRRGAVADDTELQVARPNGEVEHTTVGAFLRRQEGR